jgi:translation initiation factor 1 (eIF-1/SUI1)
VKDRIIEIQGEQVTKIRSTLEAEGFVVGGVK